MIRDFKEEFISNLPGEDFSEVDYLISLALESAEDQSSKGGWELGLTIERHNALNDTYHMEITKENEEYDICISFYCGVDVGCEIVDYSFFGVSELYKPRFQSVLIDIIPDYERIKNKNKKLVESIFNSHKGEILDAYSKMNYDNYVTGGGTTNTNSHYKKYI